MKKLVKASANEVLDDEVEGVGAADWTEMRERSSSASQDGRGPSITNMVYPAQEYHNSTNSSSCSSMYSTIIIIII